LDGRQRRPAEGGVSCAAWSAAELAASSPQMHFSQLSLTVHVLYWLLGTLSGMIGVKRCNKIPGGIRAAPLAFYESN